MLNFGEGQQVERALSAGTKSADTLLRMIGPRLYVISADACNTYNLDHPDEHESLYGEELPLTPISAAYVGTDFRLFVGEDPDAVGPAPAPAAPAAGPAQAGANAPAQPAPAAPPPPRISCELYAFGRYQTNHGESGRLDYQVKIADPSGVMPAWQPFDGGICYLSADHKLHILMGAKP